MDWPTIASRATFPVQYAIKSPPVPADDDTNAAYAIDGGSVVNGPKVSVPELDEVDGSPDGAVHAHA